MMDRAFAGLAAGAIGALIGTPADLALVRMQTDSLRPESLRRNYRHVGHVLSDIVKNEGIPKLWTGALPTMSRAMALNFGMLSTWVCLHRAFDEKMRKENWRFENAIH